MISRPRLILAAAGAVAAFAAGPIAVPLIAQADTPVVTVFGDVQAGGSIPHSPGMTVGAALERTGGLRGRSLRSLMILHRAGPVNDGPVMFASTARPETMLMPGDTLVVSAYPVVPVAQSARTVVQYLTAGQFDHLQVIYDPSVRSSFSGGALRDQWRALQRQSGAFQRQLGVRTEWRDQNEVGIVTCELAMGRVDISVLFNADGRVLDISMGPVGP